MSENEELYDEVLSKRIKQGNLCIICGSSDGDVHPPKDRCSWLVLYDAAIIRNFEPIVGHYSIAPLNPYQILRTIEIVGPILPTRKR